MARSELRDDQPIEAYALLGNCESCALVARDGSLDWACLERFDADPTFSRLLDRRRGGYFAIRPEGTCETTRQYLSRTNILQNLYDHGGRAAVQGTYADRTLRETASRHVPRIDGTD